MAELHFHWTHLRGAFQRWEHIPDEVPRPGELTLARILTSYITVKIVAFDEAVQVFKRYARCSGPRGVRFIDATKPLLASVSKLLVALTDQRNRLAHGYGHGKNGALRESPVTALLRADGPRDARQFGFVVGVYLQFFEIATIVFPDLLAYALEFGRREMRRASPRPPGPDHEHHRAVLQGLSDRACAELGIGPCPLVTYSRTST